MPHEIEVKIAVERFDAVRRALRAAGGQYLGTVLQTDRFFDTSDRRLRKGDRGLRIRSARRLRGGGVAKDVRPMVTFKGARQAGGRMKVRPEYQTFVDDADALVRIFAACGLEPTLTLQKRRSSYRLGRCLVELDELPVIGRFVEIEGPSERAIDAARRKLRLTGEAIAEPYIQMVQARCGRRRKCREVTFDRCATCPSNGAAG
jgi:adenylate cyclase class 2